MGIAGNPTHDISVRLLKASVAFAALNEPFPLRSSQAVAVYIPVPPEPVIFYPGRNGHPKTLSFTRTEYKTGSSEIY